MRTSQRENFGIQVLVQAPKAIESLHDDKPSIQNSEERYQAENQYYNDYQRFICFHHRFSFLN